MSDFRSIASLRNRINEEAERKRIEDEEARQRFIEEQTLFSMRPHRPGFEKPDEMFQEGLFDIFKKDPPFESFEEMEEYTGSKIDPSFKKFNQSYNKGDIINYPVSKIDDDYCRNMIEEYYGDTVPFKMFGQQYILKNEGKYRDIIDTNDYCIAFAEIGPDPDGNLDPLCLWIATEKTKTWNAGTILLSEVINSDYPEDSNVFTKSFKEFSKNATSGKSIKEYSEMDIDDMSDYISEYVLNNNNEEFIEESTSRSLKEVKKHNEDVERNKNIAEKNKTKQSFRNKNLISTIGKRNLIIIRDNDSDEVKEQKRYIISQLIKYRSILESDEKSNHADSIKQKLCKLLGHPEWINRTFHAFNYDDEHMSFHISDSEMHNLLQHPEEYRFIRYSHTERPNGGVVRPSHISRSEKSKYMYGTNRVYFYAVKPSELWSFGINGGNKTFGKFVEEYKPKRGDKFYIDNTMFGNTPDHMAVFINTSTPLKVVPFSTKDPEYIKSVNDYLGESYNEPFSDEEYDVFVEAKISAAERNELEDDDFGLVYEDENGKKIRKYPLTDEQHVLQAVRFFGDCPDEYKPLLAHNILKRAKKFGMDDSNWDKIHEWNEKYSEDEDKVNESYYDDYIQEATSRSLKEVKKYQNQQNSKSFKNESTEIRKFLRKYFTEKSGKCELHIFRKDLRTDRERELYDIVCKDLGSCENDTTLAKTKICNYLGIDKNMFELIQPGWDIRESASDRVINLTFKKIYGYERRMTYSGIRFIHLTKYRKMTSLKPFTRNTVMSRVYAEPCVFFFAVKASTIDEAIKKLVSSDDYIEMVPGSTTCAYEYIPRGNVEVFLDSLHMTNKQMKAADFKEVTPVFIKTRSPLPVKDITSIYHKISAEFDNEE